MSVDGRHVHIHDMHAVLWKSQSCLLAFEHCYPVDAAETHEGSCIPDKIAKLLKHACAMLVLVHTTDHAAAAAVNRKQASKHASKQASKDFWQMIAFLKGSAQYMLAAKYAAG